MYNNNNYIETFINEIGEAHLIETEKASK